MINVEKEKKQPLNKRCIERNLKEIIEKRDHRGGTIENEQDKSFTC